MSENDVSTPLGLDEDGSAEIEPRGEPNNTLVMASAATVLVLVILFFVFQMFGGDEKVVVKDDANLSVGKGEANNYRDLDDAGGVIGFTEDEVLAVESASTLSSDELSDEDKRQIEALYSELKSVEGEYKTAFEADQKRRLDRIQSDSVVRLAGTSTAKDRSVRNVNDALDNALGTAGFNQENRLDQITDLLAEIPEPPTAEEIRNQLGVPFGGGGVAGTSTAARLAFNNQTNPFEDSEGFSNFKTFDSPIIDVSTPITLVLQTPVDTRTPGSLTARVLHDVYDSTGESVVLPAGTVASGIANSDVEYGNPRLQVVWNRLTFSSSYCEKIFEKSSCFLPINSIAHDRRGLAGLRGRYNQRILSTVGYATLFSLVAAGPAFIIDQINPDDDDDDNDSVAGSGDSDSDPDEIITVTETVTTTIDGDSSSSESVNGDSDSSDTSSESTNNETEVVVTETTGPRFTFEDGTPTATVGGTNFNFDGAQDNTDVRDLYEDIAEEAFNRTNQRLDTIYQRLAQARPFGKLPSGYTFVVYPSDDLVFPESDAYKSERVSAPWGE